MTDRSPSLRCSQLGVQPPRLRVTHGVRIVRANATSVMASQFTVSNQPGSVTTSLLLTAVHASLKKKTPLRSAMTKFFASQVLVGSLDRCGLAPFLHVSARLSGFG